MSSLIKITGILTLTIGCQFIYVPANLAAVPSQHSMEIQEYQPPDMGGPSTSQGAGTR